MSDDPRYLHLTRASAVTMDRPRWAWLHRIPIGGTTLLAGREGLGKTLLAGHLAAGWTRGHLPGDLEGTARHVVYIGHEDDRATVLVPRLVAAGADLDRVLFVDIPSGGSFSASIDVDALDATLGELDVAAVIVDPLDAHLGGGVDSHKKAEVQTAVGRLAVLAQDRRCAVVGIAHLNKGDGRDVLLRVVGSVGFTTSVRSVLAVGEHPEDPTERVCVLRKANMTDRNAVPALRFRPVPATVQHPDDGGTIDTAAVALLGEEHIDADSILSVPDASERTERDAAAEWLADVLADGPMPSREVKRLARDADIAEATLKRAVPVAGVVIERDENARGRPSTWRLPDVSVQSLCVSGEPKPNVSLNRENAALHLVSDHGSDTEPEPMACIVCRTRCATLDEDGTPVHPNCTTRPVTLAEGVDR